MDNQIHNISGVLRVTLCVAFMRGKYRDVILPMSVNRRLDTMLEGIKAAVFEMKKKLDEVGIDNQWPALCNAAGQAFCNDLRFCSGILPAAQRYRHPRMTLNLIWAFFPMCRKS